MRVAHECCALSRRHHRGPISLRLHHLIVQILQPCFLAIQRGALHLQCFIQLHLRLHEGVVVVQRAGVALPKPHPRANGRALWRILGSRRLCENSSAGKENNRQDRVETGHFVRLRGLVLRLSLNREQVT